MKELSPNLKNIRNFFELIYYNNNASREEVYNFLCECLKFVFQKNNLNLKDFEINLHILKKLPKKSSDASMVANDKDEKKFDVYLSSSALKIKNDHDVMAFLYYIYVFLHEFGHIIQYIKHPDDMGIFDDEYIAYEETYNDLILVKHKNKEFRRMSNGFAKFFDSIDSISPVEKNANKQAYTYYRDILDQLIMHEKDENLAEFYASAYTNLQYIRKDDHIFYRKYNKIQKDALATLKEYGFDEDFVISYD